MPKAWVKVTPGKSTSTDLKFRWCLDPARAVPSGTVSPTTNRVAAIVSAAILRFLILPASEVIQTVKFRNIVVFLHLIRMGFCRGRNHTNDNLAICSRPFVGHACNMPFLDL